MVPLSSLNQYVGNAWSCTKAGDSINIQLVDDAIFSLESASITGALSNCDNPAAYMETFTSPMSSPTVQNQGTCVADPDVLR